MRFARIISGVAASWLFAFGATAQTTNGLSKAEVQGRELAQQLCDVITQNSTNAGVFQIRDAEGRRQVAPVTCEVVVTATNWQSLYEATPTNGPVDLLVIHTVGRPNDYFYQRGSIFGSVQMSGAALMTRFAGSDFWLADLGLEFFHWPAQKVLKKEVKRSRGCTVLESTNPAPSPDGYSRVVSWIDDETAGIVQAEAYDANGKLLKEFYPKDFKKVKGQWEVGNLEIDNVQTGSRTRLEFDLKNQ